MARDKQRFVYATTVREPEALKRLRLAIGVRQNSQMVESAEKREWRMEHVEPGRVLPLQLGTC
jgi:hypothetical protein